MHCRILYDFAGCPQSIFIDLRGTINSPNYPYNYEYNQLCNNYINAPSLSTITITFNALDIERSSACFWDWIEASSSSQSHSISIAF